MSGIVELSHRDGEPVNPTSLERMIDAAARVLDGVILRMAP